MVIPAPVSLDTVKSIKFEWGYIYPAKVIEQIDSVFRGRKSDSVYFFEVVDGAFVCHARPASTSNPNWPIDRNRMYRAYYESMDAYMASLDMPDVVLDELKKTRQLALETMAREIPRLV